MISKKIISAVLALTTAFTPVISGGQNAMAKSDIVYVYPNWVPDDYDSALEFYNTYGVTRVEGPFVCMVFKEMLEDLSGPDMLDFPRYEISYGSKVMKPDFTKEYTRSEKPGKNDTVFEVILFYATEEGTFDVTFRDGYGNNDEYELNPYKKTYSFSVDSDMNIRETDIYSWLPDCETEYENYLEYNGAVSVKDNYVIFCQEQNAGTGYKWIEKSQDYKDVFTYLGVSSCSHVTDVPVDGGSANRVEVYRAVKDGEAKIRWECGRFFKDTDEPEDIQLADCAVIDDAKCVLLSGESRISVKDSDTGELISNDVLASHPFKFSMDVRYNRDAPPEAYIQGQPIYIDENPCIMNSCIANYYLTADHFEFLCDGEADVTAFGNGALDIVFKTKIKASGDVNGDGKISIADAVLLQRWLLGAKAKPNFSWIDADLCNDNKIDIFDLVALRKKLIELSANSEVISPEPVLAIIEDSSWKTMQDVIVYDANGTAYHVYNTVETAAFGDLEEPHIEHDIPYVDMRKENDGYSGLMDLISRPYAQDDKLKMNAEILTDTLEIAENTEKYSNEKWLKSRGHMNDGNTMTVYSISKDENGEPRIAKLCTLFASDSCIDNKDVQAYLVELFKTVYADSPEVYQLFEGYLRSESIQQ